MQVLMGEVESKKGRVRRRASAAQLTVTAYNRAVVIKSSKPAVTLGQWGAGL